MSPSRPESLRPGPQLGYRCVLGDFIAQLIRNSWRFNLPIVRMDAAQFAQLNDSPWGIS